MKTTNANSFPGGTNDGANAALHRGPAPRGRGADRNRWTWTKPRGQWRRGACRSSPAAWRPATRSFANMPPCRISFWIAVARNVRPFGFVVAARPVLPVATVHAGAAQFDAASARNRAASETRPAPSHTAGGRRTRRSRDRRNSALARRGSAPTPTTWPGGRRAASPPSIAAGSRNSRDAARGRARARGSPGVERATARPAPPRAAARQA